MDGLQRQLGLSGHIGHMDPGRKQEMGIDGATNMASLTRLENTLVRRPC